MISKKNYKKMTAIILAFCMLITFNATESLAQSADAMSTSQGYTKNGPRKQLSVIFLSGLGGAVLGLSTLSFYGRPQDHMSNIAIGFAFGVVAGTVFVTYNTVKKPKEYLNGSLSDDLKIYEAQKTSRGSLEARGTNPHLISYSFRF